MVLENRRLPQISFQLIVPGAGGYFDPADKTGLAQYTAQTMREGTRTRTTLQIAQELETMAANLYCRIRPVEPDGDLCLAAV